MNEAFPALTVIGITGRIGSGKSTVAKWLEEKHGAVRIDCDEIVHELYEPGQAGSHKIQTFFGDEYLKKDGGVDRKKLMRTLQKTPKKWEILNRMVHPLVTEQIHRRLRKLQGGLAIIEIQVYEEKHFKTLLNQRWHLESKESLRTERIQKRALTSEQIEAIHKQQKDQEDDRFVKIQNNGSLEKLFNSVEELLKKNH